MSTLHERLLTMWADILGRQDIRITDDFYDLGGTSLRLIRMIGRIKGELGIDISYGALLNGVTISSLAVLLDKTDVEEPVSCKDSDSESVRI